MAAGKKNPSHHSTMAPPLNENLPNELL